MSGLFASRLDGLQEHYGTIVTYLKEIEMQAIDIVQAADYDDLPFESFNIKNARGETVVIGNDIFFVFREVYDQYYDFADDYFSSASRSDHSLTLQGINEIVLLFDSLSRAAIDCEIDVLLQLWFYSIWEDSAEKNEARREREGKYYYDISNMVHLAYVTHHTLEKLEKHFGYLAKSQAKIAG